MKLSPEEAEARRQALDERRRRKAAAARRSFIGTVIVVLIGVALAVMMGSFGTDRGGLSSVASRIGASIPFIGSGAKDEPVTVLFLGVDSDRPVGARADAIMLVGLWPRTGEVGVVAVPRDTRVYVPGRGYDRVNAAHAYGGPALVKQTMENFLGMGIDYYVQVDFAGFERLVDAIGGVEIQIDYPMRYRDEAQGLHIDLAPGLQRLDGRRALHYVRYRGGLGDVALVDPVYERYEGRVVRQLKFVQALGKQVLQPQSLVQIPMLVTEFRRLVRTDMPLDRMISLSNALRNVDPESIQTALVPGVGQTIGGASYWVSDPNRARQVVHQVLPGRGS